MRFPSPARKSASRLRQRKSRPMPNTLESGGVESRSAWWKRRPPTGVAGAVFWLALWFGLLWLLRQVPATSGALIGWMQALVGLALIGLAVPLTWRLIQKHLLWSLRSKLILTYLLIGLAPVVLFVTWATIFAYIAAGQFSIHLADTRMRQELDQLGVNNAVRAGMTARFLRARQEGLIVIGPSQPPRGTSARPARPMRHPPTQAATPDTAPAAATAAGQLAVDETQAGNATEAMPDPLRTRLHPHTSMFLNGAPDRKSTRLNSS